MSNPLFYTNDLFKTPDNVNPPKQKNPAERHMERKDKRRAIKRKMTMNGNAWKPGGHRYNEINSDAIPVKHKSGLFDVYVDPPEKQVLKHTEGSPMRTTTMNAEPALPSAQEFIPNGTEEVQAKILPEEKAEEKVTVKPATFKRTLKRK